MAREVSPSLGSSPDKALRHDSSMDMDEEDTFFTGEKPSFVFNVINDTPSPPLKLSLPKKYKPRDSRGVSDDDDMPSLGSSSGLDILGTMPRESTSVSSISDDGLVTPICGSEASSGWPAISVFVSGADTLAHPKLCSSVDMDEFIQKTLADAPKSSNMPRKAPDTPVKKNRITFFGHERPWQSAVASKVGLKGDCDFKKMPRKSLPAAFPPMGANVTTSRGSKMSIDWQPTDTEDEEDCSPSTRRDKDRYIGLGLGQPTGNQLAWNNAPSIVRSRWPVIRRSSSGALSSGSESASIVNTPTRAKGIGELSF